MKLKGSVLRFLISDALSLLGNSIAGVVLPLVLLARTGDALAAGSLAIICAVPQFICGLVGGAALDKLNRRRVCMASRTGDALAAGSLAIICAVPQFICGLVGGAALDKLNRRRVCMASDLVSALSVALLPIVDEIWGLSFGWFVVLGLLGAVGDVPGMTARDALLPEVCERDGANLQQFVGANQSLKAMVNIIGPAAAALLMGFMGDVDALWVTGACSCAAALVTASLPREVGVVAVSAVESTEVAASHESAIKRMARASRSVLVDGLHALFGTDALLRASTLLSFGISMVMGSWQGIVLPAHFTAMGAPELVGYVVSSMGAGLLCGSLLYTAFSPRMPRRTWFVISLSGMALGMVVMGTLPSVPVLMLAAGIVGLFAGPASALLGFFAYDRVPESRRGAAMGALNALFLVVAPAGAFFGSVLVSLMDIGSACLVMTGVWIAVTLFALVARALRDLDAPAPTLCGSLLYTAFSPRMPRRTWFVISLSGMALGMVVMGTLPSVPVLMLAAGIVGLFAGPASALLGFFAYDRVPESRRGAAMGALNALFLVVAPAGAFFGSVLVSLMDIGSACLVMTGVWIAVTLFALVARALRDLDAPAPTE